MRASTKTRAPLRAPLALSVRLNPRIALEITDGRILACFDGHTISLGAFGLATAKRAQGLRQGLPLPRLGTNSRAADREFELLVRRLAERGLLEYRLGRSGDPNDKAVIEPQSADYWPHAPKLGAKDSVVLSRFAYLRRRGNEMVLESPRAGALVKLCDPATAAALLTLATPQRVGQLSRRDDFPGVELLALLVDCQLVLKLNGTADDGLRRSEGDDDLVLWDFHDLLFHTHSTEGRQANPIGGLYPYAGIMDPPPAVRPSWPGNAIDLRSIPPDPSQAVSDVARLLRERRSTRDFDDDRPITLGELAWFLDCTARIQAKWKSEADLGEGGPEVAYAARPYPSGGSAYELELYLAVANCKGLGRGFYHYDADRHALVPIDAGARELETMLAGAEFAMGMPSSPQILITIAARFSRVSWKYSSLAYSLILKDVGVVMQTLYMMATEMKLGGCAIGTNNIDIFAKMTGMDFHVEGPVGQFALGRGNAAPE